MTDTGRSFAEHRVQGADILIYKVFFVLPQLQINSCRITDGFAILLVKFLLDSFFGRHPHRTDIHPFSVTFEACKEIFKNIT
jgi:hypothetical protein